ncbi:MULTISPECIES: class IV lanthionine synthetase LanL [unclassified Kitasatospora]|uniref:class IV lanthionine synthetase LanL n=1 Tax=unclassified Kitasatospora TaxID=2633591 RepID=UPI000AB15A22|nr:MULTISPECIES: class IV lanthionine synthetase LanL [unclassified Kitasatospora]
MGAGTPLRTAGGTTSVDVGPAVDGSLTEVARAAMAGTGRRGGGGDWEFTAEALWCTARPTGVTTPEQGWKLHISAAGEAASAVLAAVAGVIAGDACVFKFAGDLEKLHQVNSRNSERGSAGKFITVYPADDEQFRRLAAELHLATAEFPGPSVLSDRPYAPGSRVHYRYGVFTRRAELGNDGAYRSMLHAPDGTRVEDVRAASYRCPPWLVDPVEGRGSTTPAGERRAGGVLLGGRYALTAAIRHGTKGGVFLGRDTEGGSDVVVKQARAHIEVDRSGTDARAALRHEAELLGLLAGAELAPAVIDLIEQGDAVYLVQERVPGVALGAWVAGQLRRDGSPDVPWDEARGVALGLVSLVAQVHARGLVLRDLSPGNVMVRPDGSLRLVDLELAAAAGATVGTAGTPGYRAPEQEVAVCQAGFGADLYALGGLFFLLATGHDPLLLPGEGSLEGWLAAAGREGETARRLGAVILGLRSADPARRQLPSTEPFLTSSVGATLLRSASQFPEPLVVPGLPGSEPLVADGLAELIATATPERADRLWPTVPGGQLTDPCNVQHGAAGVLAFLARATAVGLPAGETAALAAGWIERRVAAEPTVLPGLHFGRSGTAWALLDAAEALGDGALAERAVRLAREVPIRWPNPDVCHGAAGAGFLQLRLRRATGDDTYLDRAADCAATLLASAEREPYGLTWPVPKGFDSVFAGAGQLGYAHGVAGVGAFLLATAEAAEDQQALDGAAEAVRTLAATVRQDGAAAWWPQSAGDPPHVRLAHWCSGSSGVGSFLVRYWRATGDETAYRLALAAGQAVLDARWHSGVSACHGLAGNGEYLLDLAEATGEQRFRTGAEELAALIAARAVRQDGRLVLPDETGLSSTPAYGTGTSGPLAFLLRLQYGGHRLWLDPLPLAAEH